MMAMKYLLYKARAWVLAKMKGQAHTLKGKTIMVMPPPSHTRRGRASPSPSGDKEQSGK